MRDVDIRREGRAGRITLIRPEALNALTHDMVRAVDAALCDWAEDPEIALLLIDGAGDKAFCAGGDIAKMYDTGMAGDFAYGHRFWRDEYAMNARLFHFPRPVVTFLNGFTMGGGVGLGCHGSHRIVGETSRIAMPECGIGLIPDVGGTLLLARAPGHLGEYLGLTGDRMEPGDTLHAGFADYYIPEGDWPALKAELAETGDWEAVDRAARPAPESRLAAAAPLLDPVFAAARLPDVANAIPADPPAPLARALKLMRRNAPLSMAVTLEVVRRVRADPRIETALDREYRFTHRAMEHGDFLEGIRAAIIDKDRAPHWRHADWTSLPGGDVLKMTLPLGQEALDLGGLP